MAPARLGVLLLALCTLASTVHALRRSQPGIGLSAMKLPKTRPPANGAAVLDPACIRKFARPLPIPGAFTKTRVTPKAPPSSLNYNGQPMLKFGYYEQINIATRLVNQQIMQDSQMLGPGVTSWSGAACPTRVSPTPILAYGPAGGRDSEFSWPALSVTATTDVPTYVQWSNELLDKRTGAFLAHPYAEALDQTLHFANPAKLGGHADSNPCPEGVGLPVTATSNPACFRAATTTYAGPIGIVPHLHGGINMADHSDGFTEAWFMPPASDLASTTRGGPYAQSGTWFDTLKSAFAADPSFPAEIKAKAAALGAGAVGYYYPNKQRSTALLYHDHGLGYTRLNVYAGMAGFWIVRSGNTNPEHPGLPVHARELPLVIQDRAFDTTGRMFYPRNAVDRSQVLPTGPLHPTWIPELTASMDGVNPPGTVLPSGRYVPSAMVMTVNGAPYPQRTVCRDTYRLRILNGCNARQLVLYLSTKPPVAKSVPNPDYNAADPATGPPYTIYYVPDTTGVVLPITVIGNEGGFFAQPVERSYLTVGNAERFDVLFDFVAVPGSQLYLNNMGSEGPFGGPFFGEPQPDSGADLTAHTAQVMRFDLTTASCTVAKRLAGSTGLLTTLKSTMAGLWPQEAVELQAASPAKTRTFTVSERTAGTPEEVLIASLGNLGADGSNEPLLFKDQVTTNPPTGRVEEWRLINLTPDSHPIHLHEVHFQVVRRESLSINADGSLTIGANPGFSPYEVLATACTPAGAGSCSVLKDTFLLPPETVTTIRFNTGNRAGLYVWHCHLLEHEDNEMMRPWCIGNVGYTNPKTGQAMCSMANDIN